MAEQPKKRTGRKLLVAAVGVATVNYVVACGTTTESSGNLMPPADSGTTDTMVSSGNLMPPDTFTVDTGSDTSVSDTAKSDGSTDATTGDAPDDG